MHSPEEMEDVRKNMITSKYRSYPVVNEHGKIVDVFPQQLMDVSPKEVILVDHNEKGQSIDGIETNKNLELLITIEYRISKQWVPFYRAEPVGSTNTIICKMYLENGIEIPNLWQALC